ncbi:hypothetical protein R3P38DRAFT_2861862 [Favolaschia claudopus]|uniref:Uncharacterized protein n=1 Tax=Favolaschia claudopus TaxID=2862362 RepID=A0AAW0DDT1_9AGAR
MRHSQGTSPLSSQFTSHPSFHIHLLCLPGSRLSFALQLPRRSYRRTHSDAPHPCLPASSLPSSSLLGRLRLCRRHILLPTPPAIVPQDGPWRRPASPSSHPSCPYPAVLLKSPRHRVASLKHTHPMCVFTLESCTRLGFYFPSCMSFCPRLGFSASPFLGPSPRRVFLYTMLWRLQTQHIAFKVTCDFNISMLPLQPWAKIKIICSDIGQAGSEPEANIEPRLPILFNLRISQRSARRS